MDRIVLPRIPLLAHVGVSVEERSEEQEIEIDVELHMDLAPAGASDELHDTVDYEVVCEALDAVARSRHFHLIEALADEAARAVLGAFPVAEVTVRVRKPSALAEWGAPHAEVEIRRRRDA